jgi:hypothetical protein
VFRVETTINNPREFKVLRLAPDEPRRCPMTKGVANFWRYAEVAANGRLLEALARVPLTGEATVELNALCRPVTATDRHVAAFNPIHPDTANLFAAVLSGGFTVNGFRKPGPPRQTLPCRGYRCCGCQAADPSHLTPDRQAPQPWPHHSGQEQSSLSPHRQRLQSHVARRPLRPHRLPHRFPSRPSRACALYEFSFQRAYNKG